MQTARHAYQTEMTKPFRYEQCWNILHQCPKWNAAFETKMSRGHRAKEVQSSPASIDSPDTAESNEVERPEGLKKTKERKKKSSESTELMNDFLKKIYKANSIWKPTPQLKYIISDVRSWMPQGKKLKL